MPKIWGHRGCMGENNPPENSRAAFREAIRQKADGVELDVFLTADDKLVVFHDDELHELTNGKGRIVDFTLKELQALKLRKIRHSAEFSDETIPSLSDVLNDIGPHLKTAEGKNFVVNIEIKKDAKGRDIAGAVARELRLRREHGWGLHNFTISSFEVDSLTEMRKSMPEVSVGALFEGGAAPWDTPADLLTQKLKDPAVIALKADTINLSMPSFGYDNNSAFGKIQSYGAKPLGWTFGEVNPATLSEEAQAAAAAQIHQLDVMITNYPREMRAMLEKHPAVGAAPLKKVMTSR